MEGTTAREVLEQGTASAACTQSEEMAAEEEATTRESPRAESEEEPEPGWVGVVEVIGRRKKQKRWFSTSCSSSTALGLAMRLFSPGVVAWVGRIPPSGENPTGMTVFAPFSS